MSKQVWLCEKCKSTFDTLKLANECELSHWSPIRIINSTFTKSGRGYRAQAHPELIRVQFKNIENHQYTDATYKLVSIGMKGL